MDDSTIFLSLTLVILGGACVFFVLVLLGMGTLLVWFSRRTGRVFQEADRELATDTGFYLNEVANQLLPCEPDALEDFASLLEITGRRVGPSLHYRGKLKSLKQMETPGWLAFDLQLKFGKGFMKMRAVERDYELDVERNNISEVRVDGIPLGQIHARGRNEIILLSVDGRPLGRYQHQRPDMGFRFSAKVYYLRPGYLEPTYSPVEIRGRQAAEFNNNMILSQHLQFLQGPVQPLYQNLAPDLTSEETDWLMALLALEIYYRIARHLSDKSR